MIEGVSKVVDRGRRSGSRARVLDGDDGVRAPQDTPYGERALGRGAERRTRRLILVLSPRQGDTADVRPTSCPRRTSSSTATTSPRRTTSFARAEWSSRSPRSSRAAAGGRCSRIRRATASPSTHARRRWDDREARSGEQPAPLARRRSLADRHPRCVRPRGDVPRVRGRGRDHEDDRVEAGRPDPRRGLSAGGRERGGDHRGRRRAGRGRRGRSGCDACASRRACR